MDFGSGFLFVAAITVLTGYAAFQQFLRHQRRAMIHRERLAALERGVELPPLEQEILRRRWNVQRILLFAGLVWISLGVSIYLVLNALVGQTFHFNWGLDRFGNPVWVAVPVRDGMQWIGLGFLGVGLSHLIVRALGARER
jgi:hypothetical protein